jgi:Flp pilus assembly protein TadG
MKKRFPLPQQTERRRAAALVEMAMVLPIFVTVTLGIVEFGRAMMVAQLVTNAAREGARLGALDGTTNAEVTQAVTEFLQASTSVAAGDVTVVITVTAAPGNPNPNNQVANATVRDAVNVQVQIPFNKVSFLDGDYLDNANLVGNATMRHE